MVTGQENLGRDLADEAPPMIYEEPMDMDVDAGEGHDDREPAASRATSNGSGEAGSL